MLKLRVRVFCNSQSCSGISSLQLRSQVTSFSRRYATLQSNPPPQPPSRSLSHHPPPPSGNNAALKARPSTNTLEEVRKLQKIDLTEKLYTLTASSKTPLYKASRRLTTFRLQSWGLAAVCMSGISWFFYEKALDAEELRRRGVEYASSVSAAYVVVCVFLSGAATLSVRRTGGHIQQIGLVKKLDHVFLQVDVRRRIPFMKYRFLVRPYNLLIDSRVVQMSEIPTVLLPRINSSSASAAVLSVTKDIPKAISRTFYNYIFLPTSQFFTQEGVLSVDIAEDEAAEVKTLKGYSINLDGELLASKDTDNPLLFEIATLKDPYAPDPV